uniref:LRRCT domain-containing protein n=1 Tax=Tetranychus urticae TaxID=32264 RepID=T1KU38_TETUR
MLTITFLLNFVLVFIRLTNGYSTCPPIELRSSLTPKQTKSGTLNPSLLSTKTTTPSTLISSVLYSSPSSSSTTTSDGSNGSSSLPKIVCDCTTEVRESAPSWEILCYQEPDYHSEATVDPETVQYSALPIAFIIKYVSSRYIEINCYDSSPEFQPAMFQGFGVNEIDSFRVINCSLPTVPFNLIFHRTSIGSNKDSISSSSINKHQANRAIGNGSPQLDTGGTTSNKVKGIRSLELRRATPIKVDVKQLKHLFHGLDRLEQLTLENYIIAIPAPSEKLISNVAAGGLEGRRTGRRFKRSFGSRLNSSDTLVGSKYLVNEKKVTINPISGSSPDFDPSTGFTVLTMKTTVSPSSQSPSLSPLPSSSSSFSSSRVITTKAPTTFSVTAPPTTLSGAVMTMTTKKPTSIEVSKLPENNKFYTPKAFDGIDVNNQNENHSNSDKRTEDKSIDETMHKSSTSSSSPSPLSSSAPTSALGLTDTKPSLPVVPETDDLSADKSTLIPGVTVNRQESQSSYQYLANSIDFSFGSYFPMLKSLVLSNFLVTKSSESALILRNLLSNLNNLEQLDLRSNILTHIPENLFSGSGRKLKRLYLMRNSIESLHPYAFINLKELEVLDLFSNKIQLLPDSLLKDTNKLKQFRIKTNNFITLPLNLFASTPLLTSLDLSSNRELSLLPVDLLKGLHNLRDITINDCNLNRFTTNPAKFFSYASNLEKIELKGNLLTNLTQARLFARNPKLTTLDVSNNRIKEIDADIFSENSSSLTNLNLSKNDLSFIPDKLLYHLKNLRVLNIGNNNLHTINNNIFYTLSNLEVLDLSRNQLITVNPGESKIPFGLGAYLKKINLSHNNLTYFNREFNSIQWNLHLEIEEINLSHNKLQGQVKIPIFYSTKSKIILDLRDNQIDSVNMDAILINEKLFIEILDSNKAYADGAESSEVKVFISGNPFNCDCNLFPLLKYTRSNPQAKYENLVEKVSFDISSDNLKCFSPSRLKGKSFYELNTIDLTCPLVQSKVCPSFCDCWFRAHDERILIDCQSKNLSSIPEEIVDINNYQDLNTPGIKAGTPIKAVTLKMQNNRINDLQPLERLDEKDFHLEQSYLNFTLITIQ